MTKSHLFRHILVLEDQHSRKVICLEKSKYTLGRDRRNSIVIANPKVSRIHATFLRFKNEHGHDCYRIIDGSIQGKKSTNGLYINGKKTHFRELKHGDHIVFSDESVASYYVIFNLEDLKLFDLIDGENSGDIKVEDKQTTGSKITIKSDLDLDNLSQEELIRLASFSELSPNPIIEMDFSGKITYINPIARAKFKDIDNASTEHPLLSGLLNLEYNENGNLITREIKFGDNYLEEYIHYLADIKVIRIYIFEPTESKKLEENLEHQTFYDNLTGLPNRTMFNEYLSKALNDVKRGDHILGVMFIDLDNFKQINNSLGQEMSDRILQVFGKKLKSCLREGDLLSRWSDDKFTLMLPNISNRQDVINIAKRILEALDSPLNLEEGESILVQSSIGVALYPQDGEDIETIFNNADLALLKAKKEGRNKYNFFS